MRMTMRIILIKHLRLTVNVPSNFDAYCVDVIIYSGYVPTLADFEEGICPQHAQP